MNLENILSMLSSWPAIFFGILLIGMIVYFFIIHKYIYGDIKIILNKQIFKPGDIVKGRLIISPKKNIESSKLSAGIHVEKESINTEILAIKQIIHESKNYPPNKQQIYQFQIPLPSKTEIASILDTDYLTKLNNGNKYLLVVNEKVTLNSKRLLIDKEYLTNSLESLNSGYFRNISFENIYRWNVRVFLEKKSAFSIKFFILQKAKRIEIQKS